MYSTLDLIRDVWGYVRPYKWRFWWGTFCRVAGDTAWLYQAYALAALVNFFTRYHVGDSLTPVYVVFGFMILAALARFGGLYIAKTNCYAIGERVLLDAELKAMRHLFLLDISWHEKENTGNKFKKVDRGASSLDHIVRMWVNNYLEISVNLIGVVFVMAAFDRIIAGAIVVYFVSFYFLARFHIKRAVVASNIVNAKEEHQSGLIFESINNIRSVKVMAMASPITSALVVLEVGARPKGHASLSTCTSKCVVAYCANEELGLPVIAMMGMSSNLMSGSRVRISAVSPE